MNPAPELAPQLKALRLSGILDSLAARNRQAIESKLAYTEFLALLISDELARCQVPCDHIPIRSWPFFQARALLQAVIASFKAEQHP